MGWKERDAAYVRLNDYIRGKTIVRLEYPVSLGEDIRIEFTDGTSVTFDLEGNFVIKDAKS